MNDQNKISQQAKNSIIQINNDDNLCCPRAIVVALSTHKKYILGHELDENKIIQFIKYYKVRLG